MSPAFSARGRVRPVSALSVLMAVTALLFGGLGLAACRSSGSSSGTSAASSGKIAIVAAENQYGDVASQIGGDYVSVTSIEANPNTDPHEYQVSPQVAAGIGQAQVVIMNGLGYDDWVTKIADAQPNSNRTTLNVQALRKLPDSTPNPHLWYDPPTMPAVAAALVQALSRIQPAQADHFKANEQTFLTSLKPWQSAIASFKSQHSGASVATTEPVADYLLQAMGIKNLTPWNLQADIMNGTDPTPQDVSFQNGLFSQKDVKAFVYNHQVTDELTRSFMQTAEQSGIPIVGVYETMPSPGFTYQRWMLAETEALQNAIVSGTSKGSL